jgi:hypothetical protein
LLREHKYDDHAALAEERSFLKAYTVPFAQLDPLKTILVFSHEHNTYDKRRLLDNPHPGYVQESPKTVDMFVKEADAKKFYTEDITSVLQDYEPGRPEMKPDVLEQTKKLEEFRRKELERMAAEQSALGKNQSTVVYTSPDGTKKEMTNEEIVTSLSAQHRRIYELEDRLEELEGLLEEKDSECGRLRGLNQLLTKRLAEKIDVVVKELPTEADVITDELFS